MSVSTYICHLLRPPRLTSDPATCSPSCEVSDPAKLELSRAPSSLLLTTGRRAAQRCPSKMSRKAGQGLREAGTVTVGRDCLCLGGAINDGVSDHMCSSHRWKVSPWEVNAHYSSSDHMVVFPAGLLQPPFFHPDYPRYGPFSTLGRKFPKSDGQML